MDEELLDAFAECCLWIHKVLFHLVTKYLTVFIMPCLHITIIVIMFGIQQFLVIGSTSKYITTDHYLTSLVCTQIVVYKIFIILCRDRHHH